jgi:hypothetical protein
MERNRKIIALIDTREHDLWRHLFEETSINSIKVKQPSLLRSSTTATGTSSNPSRLNIREPGRVERTSLPVGDIWIVARRYLYTEGEDDDNTEKEDAVLAIVERKTVNDLWSSLRDGRYHDQDQRVKEVCDSSPHRVEYIKIVEGVCPSVATASATGFKGIPHTTFFRICESSVQKKEWLTALVRTFSIMETLLYIDSLLHRFDKVADPQITTEDGAFVVNEIQAIPKISKEESLWNSLSFSKDLKKHMKSSNRKEGIDASMILKGALTMVPRMSFGMAETISENFGGSLCGFMVMGVENVEEWRNKILKAMKRPSPKLVDHIQDLFFPSS